MPASRLIAILLVQMATLVEAQDVAITKVEDDAREAQLDMEIGYAPSSSLAFFARTHLDE